MLFDLILSLLLLVHFRGRWRIPYGIPFPQKIMVVIGPVIDIPNKGNRITQSEIDKYHDLFLKELVALFERHKHDAGYGECRLTIV